MKRFILVAALVTFDATLAACTPERTVDGALGATSGLLIAGPVGLVAGGVVARRRGRRSLQAGALWKSSHRRQRRHRGY